jgi:hypothetical protein
LAKTWALGAKIYGAKIYGANDDGAKLPATSVPRRQGLGTNYPGAMPLYLGADDYGAKIRVHFLNSFRQEHI